MHGRRPREDWWDSPSQNLRWGAAHASVPPIFREVVLSVCVRKYEQSKNGEGIMFRNSVFCREERVIYDILHSKLSNDISNVKRHKICGVKIWKKHGQ